MCCFFFLIKMADLRNFSKDFVLEFIRLYKSYPCLWKLKSKDYCNREKKNFAYEQLVDKLKEQIPGANKETVIKKMDSIRGSFRKEFKKVNNSKKSGAAAGEVYKPRLWYYEELLFLKDTVPRGEQFCTSERVSVSQDALFRTQSSSVESLAQLTPRMLAAQTRSISSGKNTRRNSSLCGVVLKKVSEKLDRKNEDNFVIFGKYLATKLRKLPREVESMTERLILELVFQAELGIVDRHTSLHLVNSAPSESTNQQDHCDYGKITVKCIKTE